jgi:hypothetical protein
MIVISQIPVVLLLLAGLWFRRAYRFCEGLGEGDDAEDQRFDASSGMFVCFGAAAIVELTCVFDWMAR